MLSVIPMTHQGLKLPFPLVGTKDQTSDLLKDSNFFSITHPENLKSSFK